ncbi:nucleotidyltransferase family protein [Sutcliffiella deserti]|uniref:nucleotidyltransferase family protein n=1 Tax=Sutcliffiella deserti TaxID=2875501 RepID=UPI001CBBD1B9|nr:nucleotidyltransferase family protein [Sutcliffiella deserti]
MLYNEQDIKILISSDKWMMDALDAVRSLNLPDCWICAGFVRSKIWDTLHNYGMRTPVPDVDVIYFDSINISEQQEKLLEAKLKAIDPAVPWSVKNQARMHVVNNIPPYASSIDAISKFPETATALGIKLEKDDTLTLTAPSGIQDVISIVLRPTVFFQETAERRNVYKQRMAKKNWKSIWPKLVIETVD